MKFSSFCLGVCWFSRSRSSVFSFSASKVAFAQPLCPFLALEEILLEFLFAGWWFWKLQCFCMRTRTLGRDGCADGAVLVAGQPVGPCTSLSGLQRPCLFAAQGIRMCCIPGMGIQQEINTLAFQLVLSDQRDWEGLSFISDCSHLHIVSLVESKRRTCPSTDAQRVQFPVQCPGSDCIP